MAQKLLISTCVWGAYVNNFIKYTLPSLISKGNILDKFDDIEISFLILTERREVLNLRNNTNIKKLQKLTFLKSINF